MVDQHTQFYFPPRFNKLVGEGRGDVPTIRSREFTLDHTTEPRVKLNTLATWSLEMPELVKYLLCRREDPSWILNTHRKKPKLAAHTPVTPALRAESGRALKFIRQPAWSNDGLRAQRKTLTPKIKVS